MLANVNGKHRYHMVYQTAMLYGHAALCIHNASRRQRSRNKLTSIVYLAGVHTLGTKYVTRRGNLVDNTYLFLLYLTQNERAEHRCNRF